MEGEGEGWREDTKAITGTLELLQEEGRKEGGREGASLRLICRCCVVPPVEDPKP